MKNIEKVISGIVIVVLVVLGFVFVVKGNYNEQVQKQSYSPIVTKPFINNQVVEKVKDGQVNKIKVYDLASDSYIVIELDEDEFRTVHVGDIY